MKKDKIKEILLDFVHSETGWGNPLRPYCEFEALYIEEIKEQADGSNIVSFKYEFDEDGFSQYDKSHHLEGRVITDPTGQLIETELEETRTGVAANLYYESKEKKERELRVLIKKLEKLQTKVNIKGLKLADYERLNLEIKDLIKKIENIKKSS